MKIDRAPCYAVLSVVLCASCCVFFEREKIEEEYRELIKNITYFKSILDSPAMVLRIIRDETKAIMEKFGDERRTEIIPDTGDMDVEDLIALKREISLIKSLYSAFIFSILLGYGIWD